MAEQLRFSVATGVTVYLCGRGIAGTAGIADGHYREGMPDHDSADTAAGPQHGPGDPRVWSPVDATLDAAAPEPRADGDDDGDWDVEAGLAEQDGSTGGPDQIEGLPGRRRRRGWLIAAVILLVVELVAVGAWWWAIHRGTSEARTMLAEHTTIEQVLSARAAALLRGDEAGWLHDVDPAHPQLAAELRQMYTTLRALHVSSWRETAVGAVASQPLPTAANVAVHVRYCLARAGCTLAATVPWLDEKLDFASHDGRVWITFQATPLVKRAEYTPAPWQTGPLQARLGSRVLVAAPPELAGRLDEVLAAGEQAAQVADRYARFTTAPEHYLVYLAGPTQWAQWYGGIPPAADPIAYAIPNRGLDLPVVVDLAHVRAGQLQIVLQHEFGHIVTLADAEPRYDFFDIDEWLSEGVAEYIDWVGKSPTSYERLGDLRRFLHAGWDGQLRHLISRVDPTSASAVYAIGYLALRYLADHYGEAAMLTFVNEVRRKNTRIETAAQAVFGKPWTAINNECATYIRAIAH
jgi:hypothetical protein